MPRRGGHPPGAGQRTCANKRRGPGGAQAGVDLDLEHRPNCGGELKIIAAILEQPVIWKILTHLELQAHAPPLSVALGQALQAA